MKLFMCFWIVLGACYVSAQQSFDTQCEESFKVIGGFSFHKQLSGSECFLSVHPMKTEDLVYRDFLFTSDGVMMVFNSYGMANNSTSTGARVYTFFPRNSFPRVDEIDQFAVLTTSNHMLNFSFSKQKPAIVESNGAEFWEDYSVNPQNQGGFELRIKTGIMLDSGFALGHDPREESQRFSTFSDADGHTCKIMNQDLFSVTENEDVFFSKSDQELQKYLMQVCPQIRFELD